ncbi:MAG: hypothetical protein LBJ39_05605 [Tannerellaceae bacterium]|jgi:hypothetical protein|nr:hypothetical protein [Tannerellaceae bacterium]
MEAKKRKAAEKRPPAKVKSGGYGLWLLKNICAAVVAGIFIFKCIEMQGGYNWVCNSMLKGNMELIKANPGATLEQRHEFKLGFDYRYLQFVKTSTPEDAVILYPSREDFFPEGVDSPFKQDVSNKTWALRFLYPRKLVLPSEMESNRYAGDITHVAIVNGRGFDRLGYETGTDGSMEFGILPLNR